MGRRFHEDQSLALGTASHGNVAYLSVRQSAVAPCYARVEDLPSTAHIVVIEWPTGANASGLVDTIRALGFVRRVVGWLDPSRIDELDTALASGFDSVALSWLHVQKQIDEQVRELALIDDVTELRDRLRIETKLTQVQKELQVSERQAIAMELAGAAAHELNQPLTSILGYAELLKLRIDETQPNRKAVDIICRETERMAGIVKKIGQITAYQTKPYVGRSQILDLEQPRGDAPLTKE